MKLDPETLALLGYGVAPTDATIRALLGTEREPTGLHLAPRSRPYRPTGGTRGRVLRPEDARRGRDQTESEQRKRAHTRRVHSARKRGDRLAMTRSQWRTVYGPGGLSASTPAGAWLEARPLPSGGVSVSLQHVRGGCVMIYHVNARGRVL